MVTCPHCLGEGVEFNGNDVVDCHYCKGSGEVSEIKSLNYNPLEETIQKDDFENT